MKDAVLALHIFGLMMGAGGGMGGMIVARRAAAAAPEQAAILRSLGPHLARFAVIGLALMWLTGLVLVVLNGGPAALPSLFWLKAVFITTLTAGAIAIEFTYARIKSGELKAAARLPVLGPLTGLSSLLAMTCAVFAFH
jgi:hypothetical protein